jgi:hypothetical protein
MTPRDSSGLPPNWLQLDTERRITRLEITQEDHTERLHDLEQQSAPAWQPRDYMIAAAGLVVVVLALIGKITWTQAIGLSSSVGG